MQVDVAVAVPGERDLHVAGSHAGHGRRERHVRSNGARRVRGRELQVELVERDLLREGQDHGRRRLRRGQAQVVMALDASPELLDETERPPADEHVDGVERGPAGDRHGERAAVDHGLIAGDGDLRSAV